MRRWLMPVGIAVLALMAVIAVWQFVIRPELDGDESSPETTIEESSESIPAPTGEEIGILVTQLESQDKDVFLEAWVSDLEEVYAEEAIQEGLMVPQGSTITPSNPVWSDDEGRWTIEMTIEAPDHEPITRTVLLEYFEDQWRISKEVM